MKVFISWSGDISLKVAQTLRDWLPYVINEIEPYVSSEDIDKGARWSTDIAKELADSSFGIICVTKDNLQAPWLSFEAGALSKTMDKSFVAPFLFDIKRSEVQGPILQFQSTIFDKEDIHKMLKTLNKACNDPIADSRLETAFDVWYPKLEEELRKLSTSNPEQDNAKKKTTKDHSSVILEEILELSRDNQKLLKAPVSQLQDDVANIKDAINHMAQRTSVASDRRRLSKKSFNLFDQIIHSERWNGKTGFLMLLSVFKDEFPWIYAMGVEFITVVNSNASGEEKTSFAREFKDLLEFSFNTPIFLDGFNYSGEQSRILRDAGYYLFRLVDDIIDREVV